MRGFLTLACFVMILAGSQAAYTVLTNRAPVALPLAKYEKEKPPAKWLRLTDCELDLSGARNFNYIESDHATEMFVPLKPSGSTNPSVCVLLAIRDKTLRAQIEILSLAAAGPPTRASAGTNDAPVVVRRDVHGLVRFGLETALEETASLRAFHPGLAEDFIIIDEGAEPSWLLALMLPAGLGVMIWLMASSLKNFKRRARPAAPQGAGPSQPSPALPPSEMKEGAPSKEE